MTTRRTSPGLAALVVGAVVLVQALLVLWFAWPAVRTAPRDLPIVVAGPAAATAPLAAHLAAERPGAFTVTALPDAAAADAALRDRSAYAAFVVTPTGLTLHVASAASPTVSALLTQAASAMGSGAPVPITDVVPSPPDDPRGAGFASGFLPLLLTSLGCGVVLLFLVRSHLVRVAGVLGFAVLAGLVATAMLEWLGVLTGGYLAAAGVVALVALTVAAVVSGLGAALGNPGIGVGALLVFFLGNPISGLTGAPELLPQPWGAIGQYLPPGAGATALRSVAFFDGHGALRPLWVLGGWAAFGLLLTALGHFRDRGSSRAGDTAVAAAPVAVS